MRWYRWLFVPVVLVLMVLAYLIGYQRAHQAQTSSEQALLEEQFRESMAGAVLEGSFTIDGAPAEAAKVERYSIEKVEQVAGELWVFHARMEFGDQDITMPVPVKLLWAGDTPVVTLTDATIPGLGTFTARVLFYRDHYAGMWSNGQRGGEQFGRIIRASD